MTTSPWKWIGRHFPPLEDKRFVLGKGRYINDVVLPGTLHLATVPSPHAHARIVRIDTSKAAPAPEVVKVIVGDDLPHGWKPFRKIYICPMFSGTRSPWARLALPANGSLQ
jgi:CO/xanthine dehydrogenase Mo-binding subunit